MKLLLNTLVAMALLLPAVQAQSPQPSPRPASNFVLSHSGSYLGVGVFEIDADRAKILRLKEERGVEVKVVDDHSPAAKAGLKENDVILEYNGQRIEGIAQFIRMVSETPAGRKATLQVIRNGVPITLSATIEASSGRGGFSFSTGDISGIPPVPPIPTIPPIPAMPGMDTPWTTPRLGIEIESLRGQLAEYFGVREGVLVRHVTRGAAADRANIKAGDVIVKVNGDSVRSAAEISARMQMRGESKTAVLTIVRNHKEMTVEVTIGSDRRSEASTEASCYTA